MKNKGTAIVLALFLGGLGIHQFYLNNSGKGVLYLVFCRTLIPGIIAIIDIVILLTMSKDEFDEKYNTLFLHIIRGQKQ